MKACCPGRLVNLHGQLRAAGSHINGIAALWKIFQNAILPEVHLFHILRITHDADHRVTVCHTLLYRIAPDGTLRDHILHLRFGSCINGNLKACLH